MPVWRPFGVVKSVRYDERILGTIQTRSMTQVTSGFRLRAARRGDAEAIRGLLTELGYPGSGDAGTIHWILSHPEMEVIVAADPADKVIGMLTLSHRPQLRAKGRIARIEELVVNQACRRRGVGRALVARARERAAALDAKRLELITHGADDESVRAFCADAGFAEDAARIFRLSSAGEQH